MFNLNLLNDLENPVKHIQLMMDSVLYINNRLETFYNTEKERADIQRNVDYLKIMLNKNFILQNINQSQLDQVNSAIDSGEAALSVPQPE